MNTYYFSLWDLKRRFQCNGFWINKEKCYSSDYKNSLNRKFSDKDNKYVKNLKVKNMIK